MCPAVIHRHCDALAPRRPILRVCTRPAVQQWSAKFSTYSIVRVNAARLSAKFHRNMPCSESQMVQETGPPAAESSNWETNKWDSDCEAFLATPFPNISRCQHPHLQPIQAFIYFICPKLCQNANNMVNMDKPKRTTANLSWHNIESLTVASSLQLPARVRSYQPVNGKHKFRPDASKQTIFQLQEAVGHAIDGLPFPARVVGLVNTMTPPHSYSEAPGDNPCPHAAFIPSKRFSPCALLSYIDIAMRWPQGGPYCAFAPGQRCNNGVPNSALTQLLGWTLLAFRLNSTKTCHVQNPKW